MSSSILDRNHIDARSLSIRTFTGYNPSQKTQTIMASSEWKELRIYWEVGNFDE